MDKDTRKDLRFEIRARELVLKRLKSPAAHARSLGEKKKQDRIARIEELSSYKSYNEAQEAYGWGYITEEEFWEITDFLEKNEDLKEVKSVEEYASEIINTFMNRLYHEIASLQFELLPPKEQEKLRKKNEEILERRRQRNEKEGGFNNG